MPSTDPKMVLASAKLFTACYIQELCQELEVTRQSGTLPQNGEVRRLMEMLKPLKDNTLSLAEMLIKDQAVQLIAENGVPEAS